MAVIAQFERKWYRAVVNAVDGADIHVTYVDYGNQSTLSYANIRAAPLSYAEEPPLAIPCGLYNICPIKGKWNSAAIELFASVVNQM